MRSELVWCKDSVKNGGVASFGFEYYALGYTTGKMAVDMLKHGKKPEDTPVQIPESLDLG
ncbi:MULTISPECIES: ABC transporter substrate binding protein [Paenibacillus]|uniref:ABC transporter substrate binding protein n=1 Tax=Paenibacillus TaxID=44249 RepID=UPI0035A24E15